MHLMANTIDRNAAINEVANDFNKSTAFA